MKLLDIVDSGVLNANEAKKIFSYAKENSFAIPAVNVVGTSSINSVLEAAKKINSPVIIQFSHGGSSFFAGNSLDNSSHNASILGAISGAKHIHTLAKEYNIPVILHTDHASKKLLPWIDGLIKAGIDHFKSNNRPLFTSHMLDLSQESLANNISICVDYFKKMNQLNMMIEIELGITGGEEDGVDNSNIDNSLLYTQPKDVYYAYRKLNEVSPNFTIAASFGNVHGVYKPGNVRLSPEILLNSQNYIIDKLNLDYTKPVDFVFHGGSGSSLDDIRTSIKYGVIKMNIDTDTQWSFWNGVRNYQKDYESYLNTQIGNKDGDDIPNKKYYDPRKWLRVAEDYTVKRLLKAFEDLESINKN